MYRANRPGPGSKILANAAPAPADATIIARLRAAGAVLVGRTNMTEFAYSGHRHESALRHAAKPVRAATRVRASGGPAAGALPAGSSSGAAVSVTDGMALVGIGTDTGGSVRIPAALCGITGFKPTTRRVPRDGAYPLS